MQQDNYKSKEMGIIEINFSQEDEKLIKECINGMNQRIIFYKKYGKGIEKACKENNKLAQKIFNLILLKYEQKLVDVIGLGIPTFDEVIYLPYPPEGEIERSEIIGKFSTSSSKTYVGSVTFIKNKKSGYEKIYFLFKRKNSVIG